MAYNSQFAVPGANVGHVPHRPSSATPPPGISQLQQPQQYLPPSELPQQQQPQHVTRVSDTGDDGFDLDNIPSPNASPKGAGTGPATAQQQHQMQQLKSQQQHVQYSQPNISQPAAYLQQPSMLGGRQQGPQQHVRNQQTPQPQQQQQKTMQQPPQQQAQLPHQALAQMGQFHKPQPQQPQQRGLAAATRPGVMTAQQQIAAADQVAQHSRKGVPAPSSAVRPGPNLQHPAPGQELPAAAQAALAARQGHQQPHMPAQQPPQQQQHPPPQVQQQRQPAAAAAAAGVKRKREAPPLLLAPDDALSLETVIYRTLQGLPLGGATAAGELLGGVVYG